MHNFWGIEFKCFVEQNFCFSYHKVIQGETEDFCFVTSSAMAVPIRYNRLAPLHSRVELRFLACSTQDAPSTCSCMEQTVLAQVSQRCCGISLFGHIQKLFVLGPRQLALLAQGIWTRWPPKVLSSLCFCQMGNGLVHLGWMASDCHCSLWSGHCGNVTSNTSKFPLHKCNQKHPDRRTDDC